jgi:hypothetical protein
MLYHKLSYLQFFFQIVAGLLVFAAEVLQKFMPLVHFAEQAAAGRIIFFMGLQMLGELPDFFGQNSYLHLGRTRVRSMGLMLFDDSFFGFFIQHISCASPSGAANRIGRGTEPSVSLIIYP